MIDERLPCLRCVIYAICRHREKIVCQNLYDMVDRESTTSGQHTIWESALKILPEMMQIARGDKKHVRVKASWNRISKKDTM